MKEFHQLLRQLNAVGDVEIPMDVKFYDRLHAKVMSRVDETTMKPAPLWMRSKHYLQSHWKGWFHLDQWHAHRAHPKESRSSAVRQ